MKKEKTKENKNSSKTNEFHAPIVVCRIPRGLLVVKQQFTKKRNEYWLITTKEQSFLIPKDLSIDWRTNRGKSAPSFSFIIMFILWLIKEFIIIQFSNSSFFSCSVTKECTRMSIENNWFSETEAMWAGTFFVNFLFYALFRSEILYQGQGCSLSWEVQVSSITFEMELCYSL